MPPEPTIETIGQAVHDLRVEVKSLKPNPDVLVKINAFLDTAEDQAQKLTVAEQKAEAHAADVKELREELEAKGVEAGQTREKVDALVLQLARGGAKSAAGVDYKESDEYKALNAFCKKGHADLSPEEKQLLRSDSGVEGGFLLAPTELDTEITKVITEIDAIRGVARVRTVAAKTSTIPIRNVLPVATYEGEQETGADSVANYASETLTPFRQTFTSPVTQDQLMDSAFDMEAEIASDAAEAFAFGEGNGFVVGTGFKQPEGFLINATVLAGARTGGGAAGAIIAEDLINLTGDLKVGYNPVYILNRRTLAAVRILRADAVTAADAAGQFLWAPGFQDRSASGPVGNTLNGFPYILANSMPDLATGAESVAFGDFRRGYTIVDRTGMSVIRDEFTLKKRAIVEFTMNRWNTGQVTLAEAITVLTIP